ncbi:MAG: hypothetical protein JW918_06995 [Anaerolineae bacterium]|nr:hypothetical protein [Anaerolineae bacterium]
MLNQADSPTDKEPSALPPASETQVASEPSPVELKAKRLFIIFGIVAGLLFIGLVVLLVFLSIDAYQAAYEGAPPSPGSVVVSLLRDVAIVFVAFETMIIGILLIVLMLQVQSLVVLLRDEIRPMLEAVNETLATVRGTTQFVSQNVVDPVMKWSGYLAGLRRVLQQIGGLREDLEQGK